MEYPYERSAVVEYAKKWALPRNPAYLDFEELGGDCTNFASQCIYAGSGVMNWTPVMGWYYASSNHRTASWTGVEYLYRFLTSNQGPGPYAEEVDATDALQEIWFSLEQLPVTFITVQGSWKTQVQEF